jgi:1-acyl-sn-glycerol-3-phosphate acyltransferase
MRLSGYLDAEQDPYSFALQATRLLDWGISLLFFPEGTRRKEVPLAKFQSGAFWLAVRTQTPIVPVCIKGTGRLLPPGKKTFTPGKIGIEFLSPVNPSRFAQEDRPVRALSEHVQHRMRACLVAS